MNKRKRELLQIVWEGYRRSKDVNKWIDPTYYDSDDYVNYHHQNFTDKRGFKITRNTPAEQISPYVLEMIFSTSALKVDMDTHRQLRGQVKKQPFVNIRIDLSRNKTQILSEVEEFVGKLQAVRKEKGFDGKLKPEGAKDVIKYKLSDFKTYDDFQSWRQMNGTVPFHKIARKRLGKKEIPTDVDKKAKELSRAYKRAKWVKDGGYKALLKKS
jgi:hypothetical protein